MTAQDQTYEDTSLPLPLSSSVPQAYRDDIRDLFDTWHTVRGRNYALTELYNMHNTFHDLGIVELPKSLRNAGAVVGWPKKAVDVKAVRSRIDGFVMAGERSPELDAIARRSRLNSRYLRSCRSSLVHGVSFLAVDGHGDGVRIRGYSANQACALWDKAEDRPSCGVVCADVDRQGCASRYIVYEPDAVLDIRRMGERPRGRGRHWEWSCEEMPNPVGRPLIEPLIHDPDDDRPLGHSRITPEVISITDKAMRDVLNMDIAAAFWTFPQRYMLGVDKGLFADDAVGPHEVVDEQTGEVVRLKTRMEAYLGKILALTRDENGELPLVGQFEPLDPGGLIRVFENDAQRFSGATNVPLAQLGVLSNTYTSSDALGAANDPLILDVEVMNLQNGDSLAAVARMALCARRGCAEDGLSEEERGVEAYFADPSKTTEAARADSWTKFAAADGSVVGTDVWYEGMGLSHATIGRLRSEQRRASATEALGRIADAMEAQGGRQAAPGGVEGPQGQR